MLDRLGYAVFRSSRFNSIWKNTNMQFYLSGASVILVLGRGHGKWYEGNDYAKL